MLFKAARPTLLNGIEDITGRSDLADRAIFLTLGPIGEEQRRCETELWREFELARPAILGALLDAAAHGLGVVGSVHLGRLPRMADFALWATACETGLWPAGTFTRAYTANRKAAIEGIVDADPIAACVREFMSERRSWTGSATDFLRVSVERSSDRIPRGGTGWPRNPRALAGHLRRAQTFLRALGIEIAFSREGRAGSRVIRMRSSPENTGPGRRAPKPGAPVDGVAARISAAARRTLAAGREHTGRRNQPRHDHRDDEVTTTVASRPEQTIESDVAQGAEYGRDMAVRQRAAHHDGLLTGRRDFPALEQRAQAFDDLGWPIGQIGDRALFDFSAVAIALSQQDGGRRVPVRDGFDIHGATMPRIAPLSNDNIINYMATFLWSFS